ncbi:hypothetical protein [Ekhidna sp.]|uniref:hypothetical protein n=1 Tax=Ekhidna sp. TaxID=2608089 RepID=UPI00329844AB
MNWISFTEAYKKAGVHRTTAKRRLRALKERKPELYIKMVKEDSQPFQFNDPAFIEFIKQPVNKVAKKVIAPLSKSAKKTKNQKPRPLTQKANESIQDILDKPVFMSLDEETEKLYNQISTEDERIIFEHCLKILNDYIYTPLTLDQCCKNHGTNRFKFKRWCNKIAPIAHVYERAKVSREREIMETMSEEYQSWLMKLAEGYNTKVVTRNYNIKREENGEDYKVLVTERETTKHISPNLNAIQFWLVNKMKDEFKPLNSRQPIITHSDRNRDPLDVELEKMTPEELMEEYNRVEGLLNDVKQGG